MKIDVRAASGISAALVASGVAVGVIAMSGHRAQPAPVVIQPAAVVASTTTHASTPKAAQPAAVKPAAKPAIVQEANPVTSPTDAQPTGTATVESSQSADPVVENSEVTVQKIIPNGQSLVPPPGSMVISTQPAPPRGPGATPSPSVSP